MIKANLLSATRVVADQDGGGGKVEGVGKESRSKMMAMNWVMRSKKDERTRLRWPFDKQCELWSSNLKG